MKTKFLALGALLALPILGCGSSNTGSFTFVVYDLASPVDGGGGNVLPPLPPFVGQQIDRMGRPGISRLLLNPFNLAGGGRTLLMVQDSYNTTISQTDTQSGWPSYAPRPYIAENLAVWDGIDGNCGNQQLATAGSPAPATRYATLSGLLATDMLFLDTTKKSCGKYLALEQNNTAECGGRAPALTAVNNVVDVTINLLAGGTPAVPYTTGVTSDGDGVSPNIDASPFLLTPN